MKNYWATAAASIVALQCQAIDLSASSSLTSSSSSSSMAFTKQEEEHKCTNPLSNKEFNIDEYNWPWHLYNPVWSVLDPTVRAG